MSQTNTLMQRGSMDASLPHGSMLRYEDHHPFFASSSEQISMELEILEAGSRAGHDVSGLNRKGYFNHGPTAKRFGNHAFMDPRQRYLYHPASYRHTSRRWRDPIYVPQAGTLGPHFSFTSGYISSALKAVDESPITTVRPCDIGPRPAILEPEEVDMDDIFEAEDVAEDMGSDSGESTLAPSPREWCDLDLDCSASTTDVDDSSDDEEYTPSRKASPCSSRSPKRSRRRRNVDDRSPSPGSPSETKSPRPKAAPRKARRQARQHDEDNASPPPTASMPSSEEQKKPKNTLRCLIIGCKNDRLMDERSRDRHMDSHFINRFYCAGCMTGLSIDYSLRRHRENSTRCKGATCIVTHAAPYWRTCISDVLQRPDDPNDPLWEKFFNNPNADRSCECGRHPLSEEQKSARRREPRN